MTEPDLVVLVLPHYLGVVVGYGVVVRLGVVVVGLDGVIGQHVRLACLDRVLQGRHGLVRDGGAGVRLLLRVGAAVHRHRRSAGLGRDGRALGRHEHRVGLRRVQPADLSEVPHACPVTRALRHDDLLAGREPGPDVGHVGRRVRPVWAQAGILHQRRGGVRLRVEVDEVGSLRLTRLAGLGAAHHRLDVVGEPRSHGPHVGPAATVWPDRRADQLHVVLPVPVRPGVPVHSSHRGGCSAGNLVMADDVRPVQRDAVLRRQVGDELRGGLVHRLGVPGALGGVALVLETDGVHVDVPVAGVPGDVLGLDVVGDVPVTRAKRVLPGDVAWVGHQPDRAVVARLGVVDDDVVDVHVGLAVGEVVVAVRVRVRVAVPLVWRGDPLAAKRRGAVRAGVGRRRGARRRRDIEAPMSGQPDVLPVGGDPVGALLDRAEHPARERIGLGGLRRPAVLADRVVPRRHRGAGAGWLAELSLVRREQRRAAADVRRVVGLELLAVQLRQARGYVDGAQGGRTSGGDGRPVTLGGAHVGDLHVSEVQRPVAAGGAHRGAVVVPTRLQIGDAEQDR